MKNFFGRHYFTRAGLVQLLAIALVVGIATAFPEYVSADVANYAPLLGAGYILDVFKQAPFSVLPLTRAMNNLPYVPGRASQLLPWEESGIITPNFAIEAMDHTLRVVNPTPRGGPGEVIPKDGRTLRVLRVPHFERDDSIYADEVSGVREFGSEQTLETVQGVLNRRMQQHTRDFDYTTEFYRMGALSGIILNPDGSTLYNLYTEFGETAEAEVDFDLSTLVDGALRAKVQAVVRTITTRMGGTPFNGIHAFCGDSFFDKLLKNPEVRASYLGTEMAAVLREGYVYTNNGNTVYGRGFEFGGIVWENYRGIQPNGTPMIGNTKCRIFPLGVQGFFRTVYAPADYMETVNTIGLPRYAKQFPMENGKGVHLEMQSNGLSYVERPGALIAGKED